MNKILIDNDISMLNGYSNNEGKFKKFTLAQCKMAWYLVNEINKNILNLKYKNKDFFEKIRDVNFDMCDIEKVEIDKVELKKVCFGYRITDKKLYQILKDTSIMFELGNKKKFFYIFQDLHFDETIIITPTLNILNMLHCNEKHFEVDIAEILQFKSINSLLFYQWFKANKYIVEKFKNKLNKTIEFLKKFFLTSNNTNDFIRKIISPVINEYNKITGEKIKFQAIKVGTKISEIEFSI